jgi:hypothetical protein
VTNRSDGVSFIDDEGQVTVAFPDGTKFGRKDQVWTHPDLPDIGIGSEKISVENAVFTASFGFDKNCSLELKNGECSVAFQSEWRHIFMTFGQAKAIMTMLDLITGMVLNVGARRSCYYLNEEWEWKVARQLCSKKDIIQHFENGEYLEKLQNVESMDQEEIEAIMQGHKPRLFVVEKDQNSMAVKELLSAVDFQLLAEQSTTRMSKKDDCGVTLWFDTNPKTYREIRLTPKIMDDQKEAVVAGMREQVEFEARRTETLNSVSDPKWREMEEQQSKEEAAILELLSKYDI